LKGGKNEIRHLNFILAFFHFCFDTASFKEEASYGNETEAYCHTGETKEFQSHRSHP
jgi:hypothetical protein